jgi:hypothetical protein
VGDVRRSGYAALVLAVGAGIIPLLTWTLVAERTTGQIIASWALANLLASALAVAGLITGVVARSHTCGFVAILLSLLAGAFAAVTLLALALTLGLDGVSDGL